MVGVAGKYKGCHTCRKRRVPCDNTRPECERCRKANRKCKGYEKEMHFVHSGLEDKGHCSLQPPKKGRPGSKARPAGAVGTGADSRASNTPGFVQETGAKDTDTEPAAPNVILPDPYQSAWDVYANISKNGIRYFPRVVAIHAQLDQIRRPSSSVGGQEQSFLVRVPALSIPEIRPSPGEEDFEVKAQCLLHLSQNGISNDFLGEQSDSFCLFVYEQNSSMGVDRYGPPWKYGANDPNSIRSQGPSRFRTFPTHQFFARIYRPTTIYAALLNRKPVFLSANGWMTTPWEFHQKTHLDTLFDFIVSLPAIFHRVDKILPQPSTYKRHFEAQELLASCLSTERTLKEWHDMVVLTISQYPSAPSSVQSSPRAQLSRSPTPVGTSSSSPSPSHSELDKLVVESSHLMLAPTNPYWRENRDVGVDSRFPFQDQYSFKDGHTALAFIHYWAAQVLLFRCIAQLHAAIVQPVIAQPPAPHHIQPSVHMGMQHAGFQTALLPDYGIPTTSAEAYSVPSTTSQYSMMPGMSDLMGTMQPHHHIPSGSQAPQDPNMPQLQPPGFYDFGPEADMGGSIQHHMGRSSDGVHQMGIIPAHTPAPRMLTTPPTPTTTALPTNDHLHAGVPDPTLYSDATIKELAGRVCRSLCFALVHSTACLHPDTLASPLAAVEDFYNGLATRRQDASPELMWCHWLRNKIVVRKSEIEGGIVSGRLWTDEGSW